MQSGGSSILRTLTFSCELRCWKKDDFEVFWKLFNGLPFVGWWALRIRQHFIQPRSKGLREIQNGGTEKTLARLRESWSILSRAWGSNIAVYHRCCEDENQVFLRDKIFHESSSILKRVPGSSPYRHFGYREDPGDEVAFYHTLPFCLFSFDVVFTPHPSIV